MRQTLAALALIFFASPSAAAAQSTPPRFTALPGKDPAWVAAQPDGHVQLVLPVELDGRTVHAVIDTGAPFSVIDRDYAEANGYFASFARGDLVDGRPTALATVGIGTLGFAGVERAGGRLRVANLGGFRTMGFDVPLILGNDFLSCCAVQLDFEHGRARLLRSGARPVAGREVPIRYSPDKAYYFASVGLGDGHAVDRILVDTGGGGGLVLSEASWAAAGMAPPPTSIRILSVSGPRVFGRAQLARLTIGDAALDGVSTTIQPGDTGLLGVARANGVIGAAVLQRFHVVIDIGAGRMILAPRDKAVGADPKNTSGLQVAPDGGQALVFHVQRNSPAERAGMKTGDTICTLDGRPMGEAPRGWASGAPGAVLELGLCDGRTVPLVLAEFY